MIFIMLFKKLLLWPLYLFYHFFDKLSYKYYNKKDEFKEWGIHLFCGEFGAGKTSLMTLKAYKLAKRYPQLTILTNYNLYNFPSHTNIIPLKTAQDILNAPDNTLVLISEIGTLFNSRDFNSGREAVPKPLFQHLCQQRKRHIEIFADTQQYCFLDKQLRDITATITDCVASPRYPFTRFLQGFRYTRKEYEARERNILYRPRLCGVDCFIQTEFARSLYSTNELVSGFMNMKYLSDSEILQNQGYFSSGYGDGTKQSKRAYKKAIRRWR